MTVHLIRLAVGIRDPEHLASVQQARIESRDGRSVTSTYTRRMPKRVDDLTDGGSLYWVVKGVVRVRQAIFGLETVPGEEGEAWCRILLDPRLVPVVPTPKAAFQGWRYLDPANAPPDDAADGDLPPEMATELRALGLL